ncbi:acyl-CoA dehydrogenase family protein [Ramlibacter sp. 2FC]|uniref:acyl-CoA dehydrogenase family protein n=1 Tax=Ramlibacter sp. 2FC TaxID=2502188 RepID=UPI0010F99226|nr:acyl-CoA dehydrogenase family protein [Ramlibacter sp. 2FC]
MPFTSVPMFPGDLYDTSLRLAESVGPRSTEAPLGGTQSSPEWRQMLDLGWQGVLIDENAGGVGGTLADLAAIVEALGRQAIVAPVIARCAVAPLLLSGLVDQPVVATLLEAMAAGDASVCPVVDTGHLVPGAASALALRADGTLQGRLSGADLSEPATHLLFNVREGADATPALLLLPMADVLPLARLYRGVDGRVTVDVEFQGFKPGDGQVLQRGAPVSGAVELAQQAGALLSCVQSVGAVGAMIEQTIEYLNTRMQFGVLLATFQALRHRVVDMYVAYESAHGLVRQLIEQTLLAPEGYSRDVALTKLYLIGVSRAMAESAIQLHGGMGMSQETLVARLATHVLMNSLQFGDKTQCLDWLAERSAAEAVQA